MRSYYEVLGVSPDAEPEVIAAAYKAMMRKYHPDVNDSVSAAARSKALNEAYETLRSPEKRRQYDSVASDTLGASPSQPPPPPPEPPSTASVGVPEPDPEPSIASTTKRPMPALLLAFVLIGGTLLTVLLGSNETTASGEQVTESNGSSVGDSETAATAPIPNNLGEPPGDAAVIGSAMFKANVNTAIDQSAKIISEQGMTGAKTYSISCMVAERSNPVVAQTDYCVAFDMATSVTDWEVSGKTGFPQDEYFKSRAASLGSEYANLGVSQKERTDAIWQEVSARLLSK